MTDALCKSNERLLTCHKSPNFFGPVGNCINSILSLLCYMSHHGESLKDILTSGLLIIKGITMMLNAFI